MCASVRATRDADASGDSGEFGKGGMGVCSSSLATGLAGDKGGLCGCLGLADGVGTFSWGLGLADDKDGKTGNKGGMTGNVDGAGAVIKGLRLVVVWGLSVPRIVAKF